MVTICPVLVEKHFYKTEQPTEAKSKNCWYSFYKFSQYTHPYPYGQAKRCSEKCQYYLLAPGLITLSITKSVKI